MAERYEFIGDRRGLGMMQATEFVTDKRSRKPDPKLRDAIEKDAYQHGLILWPCGDSAMRYIPALNIPRDVLDAGLDVLEECLTRAAKCGRCAAASSFSGQASDFRVTLK